MFLRLLGVTYLIAFWSLGSQIVGLIGRDGILPAQLYMDGVRAVVSAEHVGLDRFRLLPTLCWIGTTDAFLRALCYAGVALSVLLVAGIAPIVVLLLLWIDYLSLSVVCREFLSYQWDTLLLEAGLIAVFLVPLVWRERAPSVMRGVARMENVPPRLAVWLMLWLLFRLMVGSGAVKLASGDPTWRNLTALTFHYETQPLPTPLAWYAYQLPVWFHKVSTAAAVSVELVAPWFMIGGRTLRTVAFVLLAGLQALIALTGNYTFFNLLSVALCLFLFDDAALESLAPLLAGTPVGPRNRLARPAGEADQRVRPTRRVTLVIFALVTVPVSALMFFGSLGIEIPGAPLVAPIARLISPFRSVNSYGLFAVMTTTRDEIVVEGSNDGERWQAYEFTYKPGDVKRRPRWVAPHQPRLDWQMWFAALGRYEEAPWFQNFCVRLLEGSPEVLRLLARNPFPARPPRYVRGVLYRYHFSDAATRRATGAWWTRERLGNYSPRLGL